MSTLDHDKLIEAVKARLSDRSFHHCVFTAQTARDLANVYGVDPDAAWVAGLLHDWDRDLPKSELIEIAQGLGLQTTAADTQAPYLLHAHTGALHCAQTYPDLPDDVLRAIDEHTVGAPEMSPLSKVVFVADMIEPHRHRIGTDELRDAVGNGTLDELFVSAYAHGLLGLVRHGRYIHPDSLEVWNSLVAGKKR